MTFSRPLSLFLHRGVKNATARLCDTVSGRGGEVTQPSQSLFWQSPVLGVNKREIIELEKVLRVVSFHGQLAQHHEIVLTKPCPACFLRDCRYFSLVVACIFRGAVWMYARGTPTNKKKKEKEKKSPPALQFRSLDLTRGTNTFRA